MLIGALGLVFIAFYSNILYYEFMHIKKPKKDKDLVPAYFLLKRRKKKLVGTFNDVGDNDTKPGVGVVDDFNAR